MKKSIKDNPKKRGRPATGKAPMVGVRMAEEFQRSIKRWAETQADELSLAEAIRRLVEIGLKASPNARARGATKARANEIAGEAIDRNADRSASFDEQASRKRRLLKGPEEFRDVRVDKPKRKT